MGLQLLSLKEALKLAFFFLAYFPELLMLSLPKFFILIHRIFKSRISNRNF